MEAAFRQVQVSFGSEGEGGGNSAMNAEELADLFELELDKLKNQYETVQRGQQQQADDQVDEDFEVVPDSERSELSRPAGKRRVVDDIDEPDEEKPDRRDEAPRPPTRKKKKKKKEPGGLSGMHIAFIAVGLLVVGGLTLLFFLMQHGLKPKAPPDPAPVLAELQQIHAMIERDEKSPDKPVPGRHFVTTSTWGGFLAFQESMLG